MLIMTATSDDKKIVRTRFAPSPTGNLHIGGARTALFNFLFSRAAGGAFVLRIDDTDSERSRPEFEDGIVSDLRWLGINWDEGPDMGGKFAPYRQSERGSLYDEWVDKLLSSGAAYPCYCSEERLEKLRASQAAAGLPPKYDGKCLTSPPGGSSPCIRFAMPRSVTVNDVLRGAHTLVDVGDFIIRRSNGAPVYLFTSVIDDYLMEITHVIRGDEHLPNAVRQVAMAAALGLAAPVFAHIPMILGADRHKLSKRTGSLPLSHYRDRGFSPAAMCAYLASLSHPEMGGEKTPTMDELANAFSLHKISASAPVHDEEHLLFHQRRMMEARGVDEVRGELFTLEPRFSPVHDGSKSAFDLLLQEIKNEYATIFDIKNALSFLLTHEPHGGEIWFGELAQALRELENWSPDALNELLRAVMKSKGIKPKEFFHPLRVALTGQEKGPPLPLIIATLGKEETLKRLLKE